MELGETLGYMVVTKEQFKEMNHDQRSMIMFEGLQNITKELKCIKHMNWIKNSLITIASFVGGYAGLISLFMMGYLKP
jgi:hypothetical protein